MTGQSIVMGKHTTSRPHGVKCVFRKTIGNGIIIDGVLHELVNTNSEACCDGCSLYSICYQSILICYTLGGDIFVSRGKVTDIKIDKEE